VTNVRKCPPSGRWWTCTFFTRRQSRPSSRTTGRTFSIASALPVPRQRCAFIQAKRTLRPPAPAHSRLNHRRSVPLRGSDMNSTTHSPRSRRTSITAPLPDIAAGRTFS
jgi:hypothetical protein